MEDGQDNSLPLISPPSHVKNSLLGMVRSCNTVTKYEWIFLGFVSISLTIVLGIVLFRVFDLPKSSSEFTLAVLLLINLFFCYWYALHGVLYEQPYEILILVISTVIIVVYSTISFSIKDIKDTVRTVRFIYTACVGPVIIILGLHIGWGYFVSRKLIFRTVGGDPFMQLLCFKAQVQCVLLCFDMQAILSCLVLVVHAVNISLLEELLLLIPGTIFIFAWTVLGFITIRFESTLCFAIFLVLSCVQPSFIAWRLISNGQYQTDDLESIICNISGSVFLLVHTYLIINTLQVYWNFGKGLKEKIYGCRSDIPRYGTFHTVDT